MEKESLIDGLKNRVGEADFGTLSEQTIDALANTFLPSFADDEKVTDDTWKMPIEVIKSYAGQYRHDLATKAAEEKARLEKESEGTAKALAEKQFAEFKAEWEKTHKTPSDNKKNDGGKNDNNSDVVAKALEEYTKKLLGEDGKSGQIGSQLSVISEFIANTKKAAEAEKISSIKQDIKRYLANDRKASREPVINLAIGDLDIKPNSNIDELKVEAEKIYETRFKEFYGDGGKPFGGDSTGGAHDGNGNDEVTKYLKQRGEAAAKQKELAEKTKSLLR